MTAMCMCSANSGPCLYHYSQGHGEKPLNPNDERLQKPARPASKNTGDAAALPELYMVDSFHYDAKSVEDFRDYVLQRIANLESELAIARDLIERHKQEEQRIWGLLTTYATANHTRHQAYFGDIGRCPFSSCAEYWGMRKEKQDGNR